MAVAAAGDVDMTQNIFNRVRSIIAEELDVDPGNVTLDARLRGDRLKADSLELISLVIAFATEFNVEMRDEELRGIATVGDVVNYLEKSLNVQS